MVVDAFRLTRVGNTCAHATAPAPAPVMLPALPEADAPDTPEQPEQGLEHASSTVAPQQAMEFEGLLTLEVSGATRDSLWDLRATIGDALEVHFDLEQVSVLSLAAASGRRLSGADAGSFQARFTGRRLGSEFPSAGGLAAALQAHLREAGSTAQVTSAEVDWVAVYPSGPVGADPGEQSTAGDPEPMGIWPLLAVAVLSLVCLLVTTAACVRRRKVASTDAVDAEAPPESPGKPVDAVNPLESDKWDTDTVSVSTGPPDSETNSSERLSTTEAVEPAGVVGTCA
jgi:hypothetical protein